MPRGKPLTKEDVRIRSEAYASSGSAKEAAKKAGMGSANAFEKWRVKQGLKPFGQILAEERAPRERTRSPKAKGPRTKAKAERGKEFFGPHVSVEAVEPEEIIARQRNRPARPGTSIDLLEYAKAGPKKRVEMLRPHLHPVVAADAERMVVKDRVSDDVMAWAREYTEQKALVAAYNAACEYIVALKRVLDSMQIAHTDRLRFYESEFRNAQYLYQEARHGREGSP